MSLPRLGFLATGEREPKKGGSGFKNVTLAAQRGDVEAEVIVVGSNIRGGGVETKARELKVDFHLLPPNPTEEDYRRFVKDWQLDFIALSGYTRKVKGIPANIAFNIHPGLLPAFGGPGMWGRRVHEAVMEAYHCNQTEVSGVMMHFLSPPENGDYQYDRGPIIFQMPVPIYPSDSPTSLGARVNKMERIWQPFVTDLVVRRLIGWDGKDFGSLVVPDWYHYHLAV